MKPFVILSLCANLALGGTAIYLMRGPAPAKAPADDAPSAAQADGKKTLLGKKRPRLQLPKPSATGGPKEFDWRNIESDDYKTYIANLRAIGCPEETIQDIIVADINQLYYERDKKKWKDDYKFWDTSQPFFGVDADALEQNMQTEEEKRKILKELLGRDVMEKANMWAMYGNVYEKMFGFLPEDKQSKLVQVMQDIQTEQKPGETDGRKQQKMMMEKLAAVLSPEELREFELRLSPTAMQLRMQLSGLSPTKEEFLALFDLQKKYDENFGSENGAITLGPTAAPQDEKGAAAYKQLQDQIKQALGEDRYKEYTLSSDYSYKSLVRLAERQGLPRESARQVYDVKQTFETEQRKLMADASVPGETKMQRLEAMKDESEKEVLRILGPDGLKSFKKNSGVSYWLQRPVQVANPKQ